MLSTTLTFNETTAADAARFRRIRGAEGVVHLPPFGCFPRPIVSSRIVARVPLALCRATSGPRED